jgi:hypothetical protein
LPQIGHHCVNRVACCCMRLKKKKSGGERSVHVG